MIILSTQKIERLMPAIKTRKRHLEMSADALDLVAARFRVLGEASRLKLIQALNGSECSVSDLIDTTGLNQANVSRHLQTLTASGILKRRKRGLHVLYSIADPKIFDLCEHVCGSLQKRIETHARAFGG
jgi:DNA-binding transcriptional ArsR family regulator